MAAKGRTRYLSPQGCEGGLGKGNKHIGGGPAGFARIPLDAGGYLRDDDPRTPVLQQAAVARAMAIKETSPSAWKRLQEAYKKMRDRLPEGYPELLEDALGHRDLQLAFDATVPEAVASKSIDRIMNIQGAETKQYPHVAPVKTQLELTDNRVPDEIAGMPTADIAALVADHKREQEEKRQTAKQVECSEVERGS